VSTVRSTLQVVGSLWLAAVILLLLMVAMACATLVEATHGRQVALETFYGSWWFAGLLGLFGVNVLASLVARTTSLRRQLGFIITHASLLVVLIGAAVTDRFAIDGSVELAEGESSASAALSTDELTLASTDHGPQRVSLDLPSPPSSGVHRAPAQAASGIALSPVHVTIEAVAADSRRTSRVLDDNPAPSPAIEVLFDVAGQHVHRWCFADQPIGAGAFETVYRTFGSEEALEHALHASPESQPGEQRIVRVQIGDDVFDFPIDECTQQPCPLGDTGRTLRVLRYLPHAIVGNDRQVRNASDEPINPAIEVEITGPEGATRRLAFARFPDFQSMHGGDEGIKVTFIAENLAQRPAPIEILSGPGDAVHVRFSPEPGRTESRSASINEPIATPWPQITLTVLRRLTHARMAAFVEPVETPAAARTPAVQLRVTGPDDFEHTFWLQRHTLRRVATPAGVYELRYQSEQLPLGFELTLDWFRVGKYPGTQRPRSFESSVTFFDPTTGRKQSHVISMNHPAKHGGYTFYQSSYRPKPGSDAMMSTLSIAWDPGQPVAFAGYGGMMIGMVWVLVTRVRGRRREAVASTPGASIVTNRTREAPTAS
jgi:hypothetical protein